MWDKGEATAAFAQRRETQKGCTVCHEQHFDVFYIPRPCGRDLTEEINGLLGINLPDRFVICPGTIPADDMPKDD